MKRFLVWMVVASAAGFWLAPPNALAQGKFVVKPLAEKKVSQLPPGELYWRIERLRQRRRPARQLGGRRARAREGRGRPLVAGRRGGRRCLAVHARAAGRIRAGRHQGRGSRADRAPGREALPAAHQRGQRSSGQHHQGALAPRLRGVLCPLRRNEQYYFARSHARRRGSRQRGQLAGTPMRVSSSGATPLHSLVMFVVDADKPFSSPAKLDSTRADAGKELK